MLNQYLSSSGYFEFPSFSVAIFSILLALTLSTIIAFTYKFTYQEDVFPNKFFQAIVLSSMVSTMVMMAVGDNLAIGFGVLGAVSIIRFRTILRSPRNIIFIFMSLSIGIATGVFGYAIAISGTVIFCLTVILMHFSSYGKLGDRKVEVEVIVDPQVSIENLLTVLTNEGIKSNIVRIREAGEDKLRYSITIGLKRMVNQSDLYKKLASLEGFSDLRFDSRDSDEQL